MRHGKCGDARKGVAQYKGQVEKKGIIYMPQTEFFDIKPLSKVWPSVNPEDKPGYEYKCKICGTKLIIPEYSLKVPSMAGRHVETHYLRYKDEIE